MQCPVLIDLKLLAKSLWLAKEFTGEKKQVSKCLASSMKSIWVEMRRVKKWRGRQDFRRAISKICLGLTLLTPNSWKIYFFKSLTDSLINSHET